MTVPGIAQEGDHCIVDGPLDRTIHMHNSRCSPCDEAWPVAQAARAMTGIRHDDAALASSIADSGETMNLRLAAGDLRDIGGSVAIRQLAIITGPTVRSVRSAT